MPNCNIWIQYRGLLTERGCPANPLLRLMLCELPLLRPLSPVLGTTLLPVCDPYGVERAAHNMVPYSGEVLDPSPADEHDRVLLEIVPDAGYIRGYFHPVRKPDPCHLPECGIRFLRRVRVDPGADTPFLGTTFEGRALRLSPNNYPSFAYQLIYRRHKRLPHVPSIGYQENQKNLMGQDWELYQQVIFLSRLFWRYE